MVPRDKFATAPDGPPAVGSALTGFYLRVRIEPGLTPDNVPDSLAPAGSYAIVGNQFCAPIVNLTSAVSRKAHGFSGNFDVPLPLTGAAGVEPRTGGNNGDFKVILTFANVITSAGGPSAAATEGSPTANGAVGPGPNEYTVNLSGVTDRSQLTVTVNDVVINGSSPTDVSVPMRVLLGDTNGDSTVNSGDAQETRNNSGSEVDPVKFRTDVNLDGTTNSGDAFIVRRQSGTGF